MAIDWDTFEKDVKSDAKAAANETDNNLSSRISSVSKLNDEEIKELFPHPSDAEKLAILIKAVKTADDKNKKLNEIMSNSEDVAGILVRLIDKLT
ncbi:hypothetical protein [Pseudoalteromonas sp.]|uniref:hypothetical protein n=1 Tax=Pseudoalteromonas sp. TaxID=53249 RepID=UPI0026300EF1|nr:hypothetical protein [Pseudoalteromonas sp.]MCP4588479.1 hypothetical protein [Pseudoalteromonas sp.]